MLRDGSESEFMGRDNATVGELMGRHCGKSYIVEAAGIRGRCNRPAGHDAGGHKTAHARAAIVGDIEAGWGQYGADPSKWPVE